MIRASEGACEDKSSSFNVCFLVIISIANFSKMIKFLITAAVVLGFLQRFGAGQSAVGSCSFMDYYCTLRDYESLFFKTLYEDPSADCGLQFWILYYKYLAKAESCWGRPQKVEVGNIKEIQLLYCSGFDLEIPLVSSLSPCSDQHKKKVKECINEFATTFSKDSSDPSLCRKRGKAKLCTVLAWQTMCRRSYAAEGIFNQVIGSFNPFCRGDKDPWASAVDNCATNHSIRYNYPSCSPCPGSC